MKARTFLIMIGFIGGYVANDIITALELNLIRPAIADVEDIQATVERIIERCYVYVYDINETEGSGNIQC